jgi:heavy metal translocating P-type ATPase
MQNNKYSNYFLEVDVGLFVFLVTALLLHFFRILPSFGESIMIVIGLAATLPVALNAIRAVINKRISIDLLAGVALLIAIVQKEWFSVVFINLMITSARIFARYVEMRSHSAIQSLLKLKPSKAVVERDGKTKEIPLEMVRISDKVIVGVGERIPVDGTIEKGEATINQSSLTGESLPVFKQEKDKVLSSTIVVSGEIKIRIDKIGKDTAFEKIIDLVEKSQDNKAQIQNMGDNFAKWYILLTILGSAIIYLFSHDLNLVLSVLLVSCADDIAVAVPMALMTAITHSARDGAIIKGGNFIEGLSRLKVIVFDKTGTLTLGSLKVEKVLSFNDETEHKILKIGASLASLSHHPISHAVEEAAKKKNIGATEPKNFAEYPGRGMVGEYEKQWIVMGRLSFFKEQKVEISAADMRVIEEEMDKGHNVTLVGSNGKLIGGIVLADTLRPNIKETIDKLKALGIEKVVMLTGDNEKVAQKISKELGIHEHHSNLLPEQKTEYLKKYLSKDYKVAMVGDGVNDAPCLALADIGIAMGVIGSDAAIESADIAMMKDDLSQIPELLRIARKTMRVIKQDMLIWVVVNIVGFILVGMQFLKPTGAAAYNFLTDFLPILNSLQLLK